MSAIKYQAEDTTSIETSVDTSLADQYFNASKDAVDRSMKYAESLAKTMLADVKKELSAIPKGNMIAKISFNRADPINLSQPISKDRTDVLAKASYLLTMKHNVLFVGPAGSGKSTLARQVSEALAIPYSTISCSAGASETWIFGRRTEKGYETCDAMERVRHGGLLVIDEFDAADENWTVAFNNLLDKSPSFFNPIEGKMVTKHHNFMVIACANTFGKGSNMIYTGRNRLDGASLDRFKAKFLIDYCKETEARILPDDELRTKVQEARKRLIDLKSNEILSYRALEFIRDAKISGLFKEKEIFQILTMDWQEGVAKQVGLL